MILRVRLEELVLETSLGEVTIPSMPDKVFDLPDEPVPADTVFTGKYLFEPPIIIQEGVIQWGFKGMVGYLQEKLADDPDLDTAARWGYINSSASSPMDIFEAFVDGKEIPMRGRAGIFVEQ